MPVAIATHLSIGSVYCWSLFNSPLATSQGLALFHLLVPWLSLTFPGIFAPASADWALSSVVPIFSATVTPRSLTDWSRRPCCSPQWLLGGAGRPAHQHPPLRLVLGRGSQPCVPSSTSFLRNLPKRSSWLGRFFLICLTRGPVDERAGCPHPLAASGLRWLWSPWRCRCWSWYV